MAFYGRRYRRYRRYKRFYRRYGRYGRRSYARRYVNGSSRSSIRLKVPCTGSYTWTQAANTQGTNTTRFSPFVDSSSTISPLNSGLYRAYANLYDEVKCIGMKLKLSVSSAVGGSDIPSLQIYTAFDRRFGIGEAVPTFSQLKEYSTYMVATAVNNSVAKLERSLYASDLLEKAQWHDSSLGLAGGVYSDLAYNAAGDNPNFFAPAAFISMCIPDKTTQTSVTGTVDIMYYFSFRNPKYGGSSVGAKVSVEAVDPIERRGLDDDDGGMDVDDISDVEPADPEHVPTQLDVAPVRAAAAPRRRRHAIPPLQAGPLAADAARRGGKNV